MDTILSSNAGEEDGLFDELPSEADSGEVKEEAAERSAIGSTIDSPSALDVQEANGQDDLNGNEEVAMEGGEQHEEEEGEAVTGESTGERYSFERNVD